MNEPVELYTVIRNVQCLVCGNKGAVRPYGRYYPEGVGEMGNQYKGLAAYKEKPYMAEAMGFGGTIPASCLNCGNTGLINMGGLEGYKQAFKTIGKL